jgi:hypothetical protein
MRRRLKIALLVLITVSAASSALDAQSIIGTCAPTDTTSARLITAFTSIDTSQTASDSVGRVKLGLTGVTPSQIVAVTDNAVCTRAAKAIDAQRTRKSDRLTLYVVAVGTSYAVLDRTVIGHGYAVAWVFDHNWNFVAAQQVF